MKINHTAFNIVGKTAHFFALNKPLSMLVLVGVLSLGIFAFIFTPKQYNPEIVRPAFIVTLSYAGATTEEAIQRVVYELTEKVSAVPGVDEVFTEVRDGGRIGTTVIFDVGYDKTKAKVDLISQIEQHGYLARGTIGVPQIMEVNPETIPVLQIAFSSPTLSIADVRARAIELSHALTSIAEVSDASVTGGYEPFLVVQVDPLRLSGAHSTVQDLKDALTQGEARAVLSGYEDTEQVTGVVFDGRVMTPEEIGSLFIAPHVRIRDVAVVYEGVLPSRSYTLYDTKESDPIDIVMLAVSKVEGSSAPIVTNAVLDTLTTLLAQDAYEELTYKVVSDDGATATNEIRGLAINLMQSIGIVAVVLFLFLSLRSASIVLIAIPATLLIVFGLGFLFDQTINRITLFALILSLGLLVDSAIVVVENIHVHFKRASADVVKATREIIVAGSVNEIGVGLFLSTVTSVVVFLPVGYITGMMGPYMGPIAFFVPVALTVSMFVAVIIIPFVASHLLSGDEQPTRLTVYVDTFTQRFTEGYKRLIQRIVATRSLQKSVLLGVSGLFFVSLIFPLVGLEHFQMLPRADRNQFYVYIDTPVNTALIATSEVAQTISSSITDDVDVVSVQQFIGTPPIVDFNGMFKGAQYRNGKHQATFRVNLVNAGDRDRSSTDIATDIRKNISALYPEYIPFVRLIEEPPGPPVRATLVAKVSSSVTEDAEEFASKLFQLIARAHGVVDTYSSSEEHVGDVVYTFDYEKAHQLGVAESDVLALLQLYSGGISVGEYMNEKSVEFVPITISLARNQMDASSDIHELSVRTRSGELVPVTSVLTTTYASRVPTAYLERGERITYITGEVEERPIIYVIIDVMTQLVSGKLEGYSVLDFNLFSLSLMGERGETITLTWGGEWEMTLENFRDLGLAMGVALALVYAVLVAQYRSFKKPLFIMVTVPLGLIGILAGFLLLDQVFGIYLTATALIGFIALVGIVVNNAIIFSEYVDQEVEDGTAYEDALVEAGGARFRPIMLTSLTTILGSLTIVSDPVWSGLAWAIVFGLSLSTSLTLIVYPTLLAYFSTTPKEL